MEEIGCPMRLAVLLPQRQNKKKKKVAEDDDDQLDELWETSTW